MANIIEYLKWRGDVSLVESPFNEIDALILSELSYIHFEDLVYPSDTRTGVKLSALAERFFSMNYDSEYVGAPVSAEETIELFRAAAISRRFSGVILKGFINDVDLEEEKQFCAMTFVLTKATAAVVFRGTDDSIIGWKEDINMAVFTPIPSQKQGEEYLNSVVSQSKIKHIYVCGHSKGGNIATYAALMCKYHDKIERVYSFDAPGFQADFVEKNKENPIVPKMVKYCPENTVVGAIFDTIEKCIYVKCDVEGINQHGGLTWEVLGKEFVYADGQSESSAEFHNYLNSLVAGLTTDEKIEFSNALYTFFTVNGATSITEAFSNKLGLFFGMFKTDSKTKKSLFSFLNRAVKEKYLKKDSENSEE